MKRLLVLAATLCALPVSGDQAQLTPAVHDVLTPLDLLPSRSDVDSAFMPATALDNLVVIARDPGMDLGIQVRAIRMLPLYCSDAASCGAGSSIHDTLVAIIRDYATALSVIPPSPLPPKELLRLRAAVEALGVTQSALAGDAELLASTSMLDHASRDVRVTVVRALRNLNSCVAVTPLKARYVTEPSPQVRVAIVAALQTLAPPRCPP
jgi:hypothetical protein